jgi:hypothetical protein
LTRALAVGAPSSLHAGKPLFPDKSLTWGYSNQQNPTRALYERCMGHTRESRVNKGVRTISFDFRKIRLSHIDIQSITKGGGTRPPP